MPYVIEDPSKACCAIYITTDSTLDLYSPRCGEKKPSLT